MQVCRKGMKTCTADPRVRDGRGTIRVTSGEIMAWMKKPPVTCSNLQPYSRKHNWGYIVYCFSYFSILFQTIRNVEATRIRVSIVTRDRVSNVTICQFSPGYHIQSSKCRSYCSDPRLSTFQHCTMLILPGFDNAGSLIIERADPFPNAEDYILRNTLLPAGIYGPTRT